MNFIKYLLIAIVLMLAVMGGFMLLGVVAVIVKLLFYAGVLALVGYGAYKLLQGKPQPAIEAPDGRFEIQGTDKDLEDATRMLDEYKRKELTK